MEKPLPSSLSKFLSRGYITVAGTVIILLVGAVVARQTVDLQAVRRALTEADLLLLGGAVIVYSLSWPIRGQRYDAVLTAMGRHCGVWFLTATVFLSQTANLAVPARAGDAVRAYLLKRRRNVSYSTGIASLAVERVFDLVALTILGGFAFMWLLFTGWPIATGSEFDINAITPISVGILTMLLVALAVGTVRIDHGFTPAFRNWIESSRLSPAVDSLIEVGNSVRVVALNLRAVTMINAWSLIAWGLDVLTAVLVLMALLDGSGGETLSGGMLIAVGTLAVSVGNLAKVLPLSQGGIGLYEAAFTGLLVGITPISVGIALTAAVLDHALKNTVTLVGGVVAGVLFNVSLGVVPSDAEITDTGPPDV